MWLPNDILAEVDELATFRYIDLAETRRWNDHKRDGELRLLTGWCWEAKDGSGDHRQGFKTITVAYRDAYYSLVRKQLAPIRLRVIARNKEAPRKETASATPRLRVVDRRVAA
jgi:hypothetical protein